MPDEARSNVYKLFRATRVCPDTCIDPKLQIAFYDGGLGSRAAGRGSSSSGGGGSTTCLAGRPASASRRTSSTATQPSSACGSRATASTSLGSAAAPIRCAVSPASSSIAACPRPSAAQGPGPPLQRDMNSARRIAAEAVKHVYQYGSSIKGDPLSCRAGAARRRVPNEILRGRQQGIEYSALFHWRLGHHRDLGAGTRAGWPLGLHLPRDSVARRGRLCCVLAQSFSAVLAALLGFGFGLPAAIYLVGCIRYGGLVSLARYRMAFYDTRLHYAVRYARHALSIDENRAQFDCVPWDEDRLDLPAVRRETCRRFKQVWFAGNHSDIGGSYPETESAALRYFSCMDGGGGDEPALADPHRSVRAQAVSRQRRPATRRAQGCDLGLPRLDRLDRPAVRAPEKFHLARGLPPNSRRRRASRKRARPLQVAGRPGARSCHALPAAGAASAPPCPPLLACAGG